MEPLRTIARLCALLLAISALGCSDPYATETAGVGGATGTSGGASGGAGISSANGGSESGIGGTSVGSAGTTGELTAGAGASAGGGTNANAGAAGQDIGAAGAALGVGGGSVAGAAGVGQFHSISGAVSGLSGTGLSLSLGSGSPLSIAADGVFAFPTQLPAGASVTVSVVAQPTGPKQTCTVSPSGSIASLTHDVTDVAVTCTTNVYSIGGTVAGLLGSGLVIQDNAGDELAMGSNGRFAFPTKLASGQAFTVTVKTPPSTPTQSCTVSGGSGTVGAANVSSVTINCSTNSYTIGGTLTGLAGSALVLRNGGGDEITLSANGSFAFSTPLLSGSAFAVTVQGQPSAPTQTCLVVNGNGTVASGDVLNIAVNCTTNTYAIGGTVTGLVGSGLTLQNNLSDSLAITANGQFSFPSHVASGSNYSVTLQTQPTAPTQTCTVTGGSATVASSDISTIAITCVTKTYSVGGTVVGLTDTGLVLRNNGVDDLTINNDGTFTFPTPLASGSHFAVTVQTQPIGGQFCSLAGAQGTIGSANITSVTVNCSDDAYTVGGTVTGLEGSGLELELNGKTPLSITGTGTFAFPELLATGGLYAVTITRQPSTPWQTCALTNAAGTIGTASVSDVTVTCTTNAYAVGGSVSGLTGKGLVLQNLGGDDRAVNADGSFAFPTNLASGQSYAVTVLTQPTSPAQTCKITNGTGTVGGTAITSVQVTCTTNQYSITGTISGLVGSVGLANNGTDTLNVTANGTFAFGGKIESGNTYSVTVTSQPATPLQTCSVTSGAGTVIDASVTNVTIVCVTRQFTIGGTVTGLASGAQVVLQNNASDNRTVTADGSFTFATAIESGGTYAVTILTGPSTQVCTVSGGTGTVGSANVTSIAVNCSSLHTVGGTISGLSGSGLVLHNGTENLSVSSIGTFAFSTLYANGSTYAVTVQTQPTSPWQTCTVTGGSGTVSGDITSVAVVCTSNPYSISVNVTGLVGTGLVLQNNNADNLSAPNGVSSFATPVRSGQTYNVTVLTQPSSPNQTCTVTSATGTVGSAGVTVAVTCAMNSYTIGGTVAGYVGSGITLLNNGGNSLPINATGAFTFTAPVASGTNYTVTIGTQPSGFPCAVSYGTGTVGSANVTSVRVNCPAYTFDSNTQGWVFKNAIAGVPQPTWSSSEGYLGAGSLRVDLPAAANCPQVQIKLTPPATLMSIGGTTLTLWMRFDAFPHSTESGTVTLYTQDAGWKHWYASTYNMSTFTLGAWKQLTLALPAAGDWTTVAEFGIQVNSGGSGCQTAAMFIDSVQLQ